MAKYAHRTFEMFDFLDEATSALVPKSRRSVANTADPESWTFEHLDATRQASVIHVMFKKRERVAAVFCSEFRADLSLLADLLVGDSRVLLDFECVSTFSSDCIDELKRFNKKLYSRGSRMVLCGLEPAVRASFFPNRGGDLARANGLGDD